MKQHITGKQIDELSEKAQNKLSSWMVEHIEINDVNGVLNIGQMIEFLYEKNSLHNFHAIDGCYDKKVNGWHVVLKVEYNYTIEKEELCDGLWEAVKVILKKCD